jgi:uncharacterized LabA/DUF88 family protein
MERIAIFIDNSNIFNGFKKYKIKADYQKLKQVIKGQRILERIFLYEGIVYPLSSEKKKWYDDLKKISGIEIKTTFDKITSGEINEKKVDIAIAIDMVSLGYEDGYDTAVLVSGDGDFAPAIAKVKELNKQVEIWGFKYSLANILKELVGKNHLFYLDDILGHIML